MRNIGVHYRNFLTHFFLWIGYAFLHYYWLSMIFETSALIPMTLRIVIMHASIFYINVLILLPLFFEHNNYVWYILGVIVLLLGFYYLFDLSNHLTIFHHEPFRSGRMIKIHTQSADMPPGRPPRTRDLVFFTRRTFTMLLSPLAILFISTTYWMILQARRRRQGALDIKNENLQSELKFLKSQTNPHFLFNALNNIYSLSVTRSEKTPELIMKLSDMLRYMLYENNEKKVPLSQEIAYVKNYIAFQRLKMEGNPQITVNFEPVNGRLAVEPLLFIPFIENSFKHSNVEDMENGWISMEFKTSGSRILFSLGNSLPSHRYSKDPTGGIGLQNVRKRLELLYPGKHHLELEQTDTSFWIHLSIETQ